jgi:hypothetical protein
MKNERPDPARSEPGPEHWRLKPLVGKWHTTAKADGSDVVQVIDTPELAEQAPDWGTHPATP